MKKILPTLLILVNVFLGLCCLKFEKVKKNGKEKSTYFNPVSSLQAGKR